MKSIKQVLMERDGLSENEAQDLINEAKETLQEYIADGDIFAGQDICQEFLGLEPDYLMELL